MNIIFGVFSMCFFRIARAAREIYIPPLARTSGVTRWYIHEDTMCYSDARKHCEQLYQNGRLLKMESHGILDILYEKYSNISNPRTYDFTVGLLGRGNNTHRQFEWANCEDLDEVIVGANFPWSANYLCYVYHFWQSADSLLLSDSGFFEGHFHTTNCSFPYRYACEEILTDICPVNGLDGLFIQRWNKCSSSCRLDGTKKSHRAEFYDLCQQACDLEDMLFTQGGLMIDLTEDDCNAKCQLQPNCWGTLYVSGSCVLMRNSNQNVNVTLKMKRKNCVVDLIETSVVDYSQSCVATSTTCPATTTSTPTAMSTDFTTVSFPTPPTSDVSCPDYTPITQHHTDIITVVDHLTQILTETTTVTYNFTDVLVQTATVAYNITEVLMETATVTYNVTETATVAYNWTEVLTETTTVIATEFNISRSKMCTPLVNYTTSALEEKIEELVKEMKVNKSTTNAKLRTLSCAKDERPSAQTVGMFGIVLIAVPFGLVLLSDFPRFVVELRALFACKK